MEKKTLLDRWVTDRKLVANLKLVEGIGRKELGKIAIQWKKCLRTRGKEGVGWKISNKARVYSNEIKSVRFSLRINITEDNKKSVITLTIVILLKRGRKNKESRSSCTASLLCSR